MNIISYLPNFKGALLPFFLLNLYSIGHNARQLDNLLIRQYRKSKRNGLILLVRSCNQSDLLMKNVHSSFKIIPSEYII